MSYEEARDLATQASLAGVGFVFNGDDFTGIDLDHCRDAETGAIQAWAQRLIDRFSSYTEVSPSGTGIHVIVRATLPGPGRKRNRPEGEGAIEVYDRARYFTVTGAHVPGTPTTIEPRQDIVIDLYQRLSEEKAPGTTAAAAGETANDNEVLARALAVRNGAKVLALQQGRTGEYGSGSEADEAFAAVLAHWTRDPAQIERLMRGSRLARDKWDARRPGGTWLTENVIRKALALTEKTHRALDVHQLERRSFDTIALEPVTWLWPGVVPYGKLTLFVGDPGHGKSLLTVDLAARLSAGIALPDGTEPAPADVLLVFCEDGAGDTVRPRLEAAGAALRRVHELRVAGGEGMLTLPDDLSRVGEHIEETKARLIVFDPVNAFLSSKTNSWRDADVRRALAPIAAQAAETSCAVLGIMHLNKAMTANALQRVTGTGAFPAVARSVFLIGPHPEDKEEETREQRRIFAPVKMNLGPLPSSKVFRIVDQEGKPRVSWEGDTRHSAGAMLGAQLTGAVPDGKIEEAVKWTQELLADGPRSAKEMFGLLKAKGISEKTAKRAKKIADVVTAQESSDAGTRWMWRLPEELPF